MKPTITLFISLFVFFQLSAQITGSIRNSQNEPLPSVNIYFENTYNGTTSNEQGLYELSIPSKGKHTLVFQYLGFETIKKEIEINNNSLKLDVQLKEEKIQLNEVVIKSKEK